MNLKKRKYSKQASVFLGLLFVILGIASESDTGFLFVLAGALALIQAQFFDTP